MFRPGSSLYILSCAAELRSAGMEVSVGFRSDLREALRREEVEVRSGGSGRLGFRLSGAHFKDGRNGSESSVAFLFGFVFIVSALYVFIALFPSFALKGWVILLLPPIAWFSLLVVDLPSVVLVRLFTLRNEVCARVPGLSPLRSDIHCALYSGACERVLDSLESCAPAYAEAKFRCFLESWPVVKRKVFLAE